MAADIEKLRLMIDVREQVLSILRSKGLLLEEVFPRPFSNRQRRQSQRGSAGDIMQAWSRGDDPNWIGERTMQHRASRSADSDRPERHRVPERRLSGDSVRHPSRAARAEYTARARKDAIRAQLVARAREVGFSIDELFGGQAAQDKA